MDKEIRVDCEELVVSGFVGRDLHFGGEKVQILEGATVGGNATIHISVKNSATIAQGAVLGRVDTIVGNEPGLVKSTATVGSGFESPLTRAR